MKFESSVADQLSRFSHITISQFPCLGSVYMKLWLFSSSSLFILGRKVAWPQCESTDMREIFNEPVLSGLLIGPKQVFSYSATSSTIEVIT